MKRPTLHVYESEFNGETILRIVYPDGRSDFSLRGEWLSSIPDKRKNYWNRFMLKQKNYAYLGAL